MKKNDNYHIQQQGQSDCGVACLKAALRFFGGDASLERIRELSGTSKTGTSLLGLLQGAKTLGMEAEGFEADLQSLKDCKDLTILHVIIDQRLQHYILCYGYDAATDTFHIGNPSEPKTEKITTEELMEIWQSKALLLLKPTEAIVKVQENKKEKWTWLVSFIREDLDLLGIALALGIAIAVLGLSTAIFSQKLIDDILPAQELGKLLTGCVLLFFLLLVKSLFSYLRSLFLIRQSKDFNIRIIDFFYNALLNLPKSFFDNRKTGELIARMNDTNRIQRTITSIISSAMIDFLLMLVASVAIFVYHWQLGLLSLLWMPVFAWIVYKYHPEIVKKQRVVMQTYAHNEANYIDTIQGVGEIKVNNKQGLFSKITKTVYGVFQQSIFDLGKVGITYSLITELVSVFFIVGVILMSSVQVLNNVLTIGSVIAILQMISLLMTSANKLALTNIQLQEAKVAFDRMYEFTHIDNEFAPEADRSKSVINNFEELRVEHLTFRFPGRKRLLEDVSFKVRKGEQIAVLGESGCGKSTLLQILQKFYLGESGKIKVNGIDFDLVSTTNWRSHIGVVSQQVKLFSGTLIDNILLGDQVDDPQKLVAFFQYYGFDQYFQQFPNGYATLLGEHGVNISGGQTQLVGLARTLWKQPKLLLLDEPTSALDRDTEQFVMKLLQQLKDQMGIIVLTHRIAIAKNADRIYILKNGRIEHEGQHADLLHSDNLYSRAWNDLVQI